MVSKVATDVSREFIAFIFKVDIDQSGKQVIEEGWPMRTRSMPGM
jgi:hypothetical protein